MERILRVALLSLMGAAAFKVTYTTLYIDDVAEREVTVRDQIDAGAIWEAERSRRR